MLMIDDEYFALKDLYDSTGGPNWVWKNESDFGRKWHFESSTKINPCDEGWQGLLCSCTEKKKRFIDIPHYGVYYYDDTNSSFPNNAYTSYCSVERIDLQ